MYCSSNIEQGIMSGLMRWPRQVACMGDKKKCLQRFGGALKGKSPLGRLRFGWEDNNIMNLQEVGWGDIDWIDLAQDRGRWRSFVNKAINHRVS